MASYSAGRMELNQENGGVAQDDNEMMLANALRKMDGLIGANYNGTR